MKKKFLFVTAAICLFWSCSKDSASPSTDSGVINPAGVYKLTGFTTSKLADLNGDGIKTYNQMAETTCYNDNFLTLNSDLSYIKTDKGASVNFSGGVNTVTCYTNPNTTGTWAFNQNHTALEFKDTGSNTVAIQTSELNNTTIKFLIPNGQAVGQSSDGHIAYTICNLEFTYTKQ